MCSMSNHQSSSQSKVALDNLGEHVENNQNNEATGSLPVRSDIITYKENFRKKKLKIEMALNFQRAFNLKLT